MGIFDSVKDIWGDVKGLGSKVSGGFSGIEHSVSGLGSKISGGFSGIEHSVSRLGSSIGKIYSRGFHTIERGIDDEWKKVGGTITHGLEVVGSDTINFVTDGVEGIDKGLGFATAEITEYIPKMYMAVVPRVLRGIYRTLEKLLPELLTLPANLMVFVVSFFLTIVGAQYMNKASADQKRKEENSVESLQPGILDPNLDLEEARNIVEGIFLKTF